MKHDLIIDKIFMQQRIYADAGGSSISIYLISSAINRANDNSLVMQFIRGRTKITFEDDDGKDDESMIMANMPLEDFDHTWRMLQLAQKGGYIEVQVDTDEKEPKIDIFSRRLKSMGRHEDHYPILNTIGNSIIVGAIIVPLLYAIFSGINSISSLMLVECLIAIGVGFILKHYSGNYKNQWKL